MATLSFRLPASRQQDTAVRSAAWSRSAASVTARVPASRRSGLALVTEVLELQPPTGPSMIALPAQTAARPMEDDAGATGATGWFDSTWDLQQGLDISEGLPADLPLGDWLKMYLAA